MTWFLLDHDKYKHALKELPRQRDRGAAIVATAILEDHLFLAIKSRIQWEEIAEGRFFSGPCRDFGARIDLGVLLGLYPGTVAQRLHTIRVIRNDFAHKMEVRSFKSQRDRCAKLKPPGGAQKQFDELMNATLGPSGMPRTSFPIYKSSTNPRTLFLSAVKQLVFMLSMQVWITHTDPVWVKKPSEAAQPTSRDKSPQSAPPAN